MAPDQFSVARPLRPEDLDRCVTRHGIYPSLPAPNGVPWSEYVRSQRNRSRSVSSSTEALESDHARYITSRIAQHAGSMATGTRSLPTDSPIPYFQPIERGHMLEDRPSDLGSQENIYVAPYVNPWEKTIRPGVTDYHPNPSEIDRVSTYTGLDDYGILFATRHGRGALDQVPTMSEQMIMASSVGITPITLGAGLMVNPLSRAELTSNFELPSQMEGASMTEHRVVSPSSGIIGEGVAIFTVMTETILNALDQQMAMSSDIQKLKDVSIGDNQTKDTQGSVQVISDRYPDLFLPVMENHRISDHFCGHSDSLSADNNPMILVKLESLSYHYSTSIYAVDRVNSTMYGKFSVGYKIIPEKAMVIPQYHQTPAEDEYKPSYVNTLPGPTDIVTPIAKSTPVTQASQVPVLPNVSPLDRDILEPISSKQARSTYLEHQIQGMDSMRLPLNIPLLEDELCTSTNLPNRI